MFKSTTLSSARTTSSAFFIGLLLLCLTSFQAKATHSSGADLQYTWISGNTYRVVVSFYRDCAGVAAPTSISLNAASTSCGRNQNYTLSLDAASGNEITFPCRTVITKCTNSASTYAGYQQYRYIGNVTLPAQCSDWVMSFYVCCRNCAITTLNNPCSDNMYIEATLNNLIAQNNNSPQFTNIPVALICVNQSFTYNHGVFDPDGDSLVYSFINPKTFNTSTNTIGSVTFNPGYSSSSPLTSSPAVSLNSVNGDIIMNPTVNNEIGVTAIIVREYRNGVLIGSVIRDMQFLTRICNPNFLPTSTGINGSNVFNVTVCPGTNINFTVNSADPNATDTVVMNWNSSIPGATFNTVGAVLPVGTFNWTPTLADARDQPYTFIVTVRDNACPFAGSQTYSFVIDVPKITATINSPLFNGYNVACRSGATASATVVANGGNIPYTYLWNPSGQTNATATALSANNYTVTVTDVTGCTKTASVSITQPPTSISTSVSASTNVSCFGGSNGTATASVTGGITPYTYLWTPSGQTTAAATGLSAQVYTVRATDLNGCTSQQTVTITQPTALSAVVSGFTNVTCKNNANGTITITPSGGTGPYTHHWSNNATTAAVTNLGPGTFTDTIRDVNNCQFLISQTITEPAVVLGIPSSSLSTTNVSCFGGANGTATVNPTGGSGPYTVTWSNGDAGNTADSLAAGAYIVHIADVNGCAFDSTITITAPTVLAPSLVNYATTPGGTDIACNGQTTGKVKVIASGGTSPYTYSWNTGATLDSIINRAAGIYTVVITDAKGCTSSLTDTLTEPAALTNPWSIRNVACKGESSGYIIAHVAGGSPSYTYTWAPAISTTDSAYRIPAGFYQLTVTDLNGCSRVDTITITEPSTLVPLILPSTYIGAVNLRCFGDSSGSATVNVFGGTAPFTYSWSDGSTTASINNLSAGSIKVLVVDDNGCSIEKDTILNQPPPFQYASVINDPRCFGDSSGYIVLNVSGSTPPYSYTWNNGDVTDSTGHLTTGTYYCIVEDQNNCLDSVGYVLANPDSIITSANVSDYLGYNVSCNGGNNGYIHVFAVGGDNNFTYSWSNASTTDSIAGLTASTYNLTILDGRGCRKDTSITLTEPNLLAVTLLPDTFIGATNVRCFGYNDGAVFSNVTGGTSPYHYSWSNGDVADSAIGLTAGTYYLTVTDSNGCVISDSVDIIEPGPVDLGAIVPDYNGFNIPCFGDTSACITLNMTGGNSPFTFIWDGSDTLTSSTICNIGADTLNVNIVDANGCQLDTFFIMTGPPPINFNTTLSAFGTYNINCNGQTNGEIDITMVGGVAPFSYLWSTTDTIEDLLNLGAGSYQLNVTDANGCLDSVTYVLTEPALLQAALSSVNSTCSQNNGTATATVNGGVVPYTYLWSDSQTGSSATGLSPQTISVVITDSLGCVSNDTIVVGGVPLATLAFNSTINNTCFGQTIGQATVTITDGTAPFTYLWSNGDTSSTADSLAAGAYNLVVTDSNSCVSNASITITEPAAFSFNYTVNNAFCNGANNGSVVLSLTGGNSPYQYNWSNGDLGATADSLGGGFVLVQITDSLGCTQTDSVDIVQGTSIASAIDLATDVSCFGGNNGFASVLPATGGIGPLNYSWSNGDTGLSTDTLTAGVYTMTITDSVNCSVAIPITISEPAQLIVNIAATDVVCNGQNNGTATANVIGGVTSYSYQWTPTSTASSLTNLAPGVYSLIVTDQNNCTTSSSVTIIEPAALAVNAGTDQASCDELFNLNAALAGGLTGQWTIASGNAIFQNANSPITSVNNLAAGDNLLVWTINDGTCFGSDTVVIRASTIDECELEIPTAYSPNEDGSNDALVIHGINRFPENLVSVYNRWGNLVYQKENYANEWKGQNNSGEPLPDGTYFLILEIKNSVIKMNTYIDLRR